MSDPSSHGQEDAVSLQLCCWLAEKLPDNVTCGEGCDRFPRCLPRLELVRKLMERKEGSCSR